MIIDVDGRALVVPAHIEAKISSQVVDIVAEILASEIPAHIRLAAKHFARKEIAKLETALNEQGYDGKLIRPADGTDPIIHYIRLRMRQFQTMLGETLLCIDADEKSGDVTAFCISLPNPAAPGEDFTFGGDFNAGVIDSTQAASHATGAQLLPEPHTRQGGG